MSSLNIKVEGKISISQQAKLMTISATLPEGDEFAAALDVVMHDRELGEQIRSGELAVYRPMPPVVDRQLPDGRVERTLTVGLRATSAG